MNLGFQSSAVTIALYMEHKKQKKTKPKTKDLASNRNKIPKLNQRNPKQQQKHKVAGF